MLNEINMFLKKEIKNLGWVAEQTFMPILNEPMNATDND